MYWFHSFRASSVERLSEILSLGDSPNLEPTSQTRLHETELGIPAPCVYAYLGNAKEAFGPSVIAAHQASLAGRVSPFDSGGLVNKIKPVCTWPPAQKQSFLEQYSWPSSELNDLLKLYPGIENELIESYVRGDRPAAGAGLHVLIDSLPPADLWEQNDDWRAWTWEGRTESKFPAVEEIHRWTCPNELYVALKEEAVERGLEWFASLVPRYVGGGFGMLLKTVIGEQITP